MVSPQGDVKREGTRLLLMSLFFELVVKLIFKGFQDRDTNEELYAMPRPRRVPVPPHPK